MRNGATVYGTTAFTRLGIGAGGFVTGGSVANDGTLVCRTDTYGAYVRGPSATSWTPLIRIGYGGVAITDITYGYPYVHGAYDVAIAATNSAHIVVVQDGYLWRTTNGGTTIAKTALAYNAGYQPNNGNRGSNRHLEFDPAGTNVIAFGDPTAGARYTLDSGATFALISTSQIPAPVGSGGRPGQMAIAFDRSSSVVSGKTQIVYIWSESYGIYRSTAGIDSGAWTLITGSPVNLSSMVVSRSGLLMTAGTQVDSTDAQFRTWTSGGGWVAPSGITGKSIASNTTTPATIYLFNGGGGRRVSTDSGVTWTTEAGTVTRVATDYPWLATTNEAYMTNGDTCWDPNSGRIVYFIGIGVFEYTSPSSTQGAALTWNSISKGIDGMVCMEPLVLPTTGRMVIAVQDRGVFSFPQANPQLSPKSHGPSMAAAINHGTSTDYCIDDQASLVLVTNNTGYGHYSRDEGKTWTPFATVPANVDVNASMGNIAASNYGNYVWVPTGNRRPSYTTDNGATWTLCDFGAANASMTGNFGMHHAYSYQKRMVIADKANPGTFYLYVSGTSSNTAPVQTAVAGLWKSTNGGATFTRIKSTNIGPTSDVDFYNGKLKQAPGYPTDLFWCCGDIGSYDSNISTGTFLMSHDSGVTWGIIALDEVIDYSFGANLAGASYPAIYAFGYLSAVRGLYRCLDFNPATRAGTWTKIGDYPLGHYDSGNLVAADMTKFGRVYLAFGGSGAFFGDLVDTASGT